jgi:hypothetical protein
MLTYLTNDDCIAIYIDGMLAYFGQHGDDPYRMLKSLQNKTWTATCIGKLKDLDGDDAPQFLSDAGLLGFIRKANL